MFMSCGAQDTGHQEAGLPRPCGDLRGKQILIAEDEFMIAIDYAVHLEALGATVVGPVCSVPQALEKVREHRIDAAVLDIDLQGTKSFNVADALMDRRIAFVFASGYDDLVIPERFSGVVRCMKPAQPSDVIEALQRVCND